MLTLIVPGLIWPHQALLDLTRGLNRDLAHQHTLPAFSTLLGRGKLTRLPPCTIHQAIAQALGLAAPLPAAALRGLALGAEDSRNASDWLCLDPIHLRVEQTRLRVNDPQFLDLSAAEAEALAASLAPTFAALGILQVLNPAAWNLRLHASAPTLTLLPPLPDYITRAAIPLPKGKATAPWRHAINEANMLLHTHPVNLAREAAGKLTINTLWPWGNGCLPASAIKTTPPLEAFWGNDLVTQGAAIHQGIPVKNLPSRFENLTIHNALVLLDPLEIPARSGDTDAWRAALLQLETDWFAPLLASLKRGQIKHLRLITPGEAASFELAIRPHHTWQFWRSAACLAVLAAP
ncbi:MAG: hypothetical protein V4500_06550 [Pseudomonadota bacterium]